MHSLAIAIVTVDIGRWINLECFCEFTEQEKPPGFFPAGACCFRQIYKKHWNSLKNKLFTAFSCKLNIQSDYCFQVQNSTLNRQIKMCTTAKQKILILSLSRAMCKYQHWLVLAAGPHLSLLHYASIPSLALPSLSAISATLHSVRPLEMPPPILSSLIFLLSLLFSLCSPALRQTVSWACTGSAWLAKATAVSHCSLTFHHLAQKVTLGFRSGRNPNIPLVSEAEGGKTGFIKAKWL